jgi:hypothetical protein
MGRGGFDSILSTHLDIALIWDDRLELLAAIAARIVLKGSDFESEVGGLSSLEGNGLVVMRNGKSGVGEEGRLISSGTLEGMNELKIIGLLEGGE